jgi:hypothetical protein
VLKFQGFESSYVQDSRSSWLVCSTVRSLKPTSALAGFMRFLHLLSQHEWQSYPLLCDPANTLRNDEVKDALKAHRALLPSSSAAPCCLITAYDLEGTAWTKERPAAVLATRMRQLAASSLECLSKAIVGDGKWRHMQATCVPYVSLLCVGTVCIRFLKIASACAALAA